jgi:hypothetical protein
MSGAAVGLQHHNVLRPVIGVHPNSKSIRGRGVCDDHKGGVAGPIAAAMGFAKPFKPIDRIGDVGKSKLTAPCLDLDINRETRTADLNILVPLDRNGSDIASRHPEDQMDGIEVLVEESAVDGLDPAELFRIENAFDLLLDLNRHVSGFLQG